MRRHARGCVSVQTPPLRFMQLVGVALLGGPIVAPDEIAQVAEAVADRTLAICLDEGRPPWTAYDMAVDEIVPEWAWR